MQTTDLIVKWTGRKAAVQAEVYAIEAVDKITNAGVMDTSHNTMLTYQIVREAARVLGEIADRGIARLEEKDGNE